MHHYFRPPPCVYFDYLIDHANPQWIGAATLNQKDLVGGPKKNFPNDVMVWSDDDFIVQARNLAGAKHSRKIKKICSFQELGGAIPCQHVYPLLQIIPPWTYGVQRTILWLCCVCLGLS